MAKLDISRLYSEHASPLYAFLSYRVGDPVLAEDLLGDTFERVIRDGRGFDRRKGSERTWLYAIALNCVRDRARRVAAEARALALVGSSGAEAQFEPGFADVDRRAALHHALSLLSDPEREVVALRFGADLTLNDIAQVIDAPRTTVESRLYAGLKKMREGLGSDF
jgi:RNA polymerase sigma factor (sigma-70 family)